ncbi:MAG: PilZ domain-containing protein [Aquificae bacterium]|jgi:hypothetical protein|nr:PilZ domain-containing protein [Aquificota bacterium]
MEFKVGEVYIAYKHNNPLKSFKFRVLKAEDFFLEAEVLEGLINVDLWDTYIVRIPRLQQELQFIEISPYHYDEERNILRIIILGYFLERRKFVRFNVERLNIPIRSEYFEGIVENVSLGGVKIKVHKWLKPLTEGTPVFVEAKIPSVDKVYKFVITPVKVAENFISAKFEKPVKVTSDFFYTCLQLLNKELAPIEERRKFRRFYVEPLGILVDTPLGMGNLVDISLKGMKVFIRKPYNVDEEVLKDGFMIAVRFPDEPEEYLINVDLVNKTKNGYVSFKINKWDRDALKFTSKVLEKISQTGDIKEV